MVAFSRTWRFWVRSGAIVIPILPNNCLRNPRCGRSNLDKNGPPVIGPAVPSLRILIFQHQESRPVPVWNRDEFIVPILHGIASPFHCKRTGFVNVKLHSSVR